MDINTFKEKTCKDCVNYSKDCKEQDIHEKIIDGVQIMRCKNYHRWIDCITKNCDSCRKCK